MTTHYESKTLNVKLKKFKIHFIPDIVYAQVPTFESPNKLLQMDLLVPQINKPMPAVIFVTGGGFISANKARMPQLRMKLAEVGYVVASINYCTVPNSTFPQPVVDVKSAIRYIKANSRKFNVNPNQVAVMGDSAGGYLTAFAAVTNGSKIFNVGENLNQSSEIIAAVDLYGIVDISSVNGFPQMLQSLNGVPVEATNPISYITKDSAPMLLMHGTADNIVSPKQTDLLFQALKSAGVEAERYLVPNANHADDYWQQDEVAELIIEFLDRYVSK